MQNNDLLIRRFQEFEDRFRQLETDMGNPEIVQDYRRYQKLAKERSDLLARLEAYRELTRIQQEAARLEQLLADGAEEADFLALAGEERAHLRARERELLVRLEEFLIEPDPAGDRNIIVEIRAGTGGEEAALFAQDLFRMYQHYAQTAGFTVEVLGSNPTELGGFKEIIFSVEGRGAYRKFKYESGVHRVQRVPSTEASGRIHTSTATVAVLPEAEEVDVQIAAPDLKIDVYRSQGAGGQHVNTTDSAVRITHLPTGIVVTCQDERSQLKNRAKAMKVLRARLLDTAQREQESKITQARRTQIGTGERSEKIRTYNFPDRRVTDHRIALTLYRIESILEGDIEEIVQALAAAERQLKLQRQFEQPPG
ncbi:MAG: peptide chain release factor 1 [Candidatus Omnitrophica bacterium]|nr:peptide chain release factor 1 [Candidatus Omnitrophota bacterium]